MQGNNTLLRSWFGDETSCRLPKLPCTMYVPARWRFECVGAGRYQRVSEFGRRFGEVYDRASAIAATAAIHLHARAGVLAIYRQHRRRSAGKPHVVAFITEMERGMVCLAVRAATDAIDGATERYARQ